MGKNFLSLDVSLSRAGSFQPWGTYVRRQIHALLSQLSPSSPVLTYTFWACFYGHWILFLINWKRTKGRSWKRGQSSKFWCGDGEKAEEVHGCECRKSINTFSEFGFLFYFYFWNSCWCCHLLSCMGKIPHSRGGVGDGVSVQIRKVCLQLSQDRRK